MKKSNNTITIEEQQYTKLSTIEEIKNNGNGNHLKFICESSLGKIVTHLRLLGIDCDCNRTYNRPFVLYKARSEHRIIITESKSLIKELINLNTPKKKETYEVYSDDEDDDDQNEDNKQEYFYIEQSDTINDQILAIVNQFQLVCNDVFSRCLSCNIYVLPLEVTDSNREELLKSDGVTEKVIEVYGTTFTKCPECNQLYWKGHYHEKALHLARTLSYQERD